MKIEIKGLNEVRRELKALQQRAQSLHGKHAVPIEELFSEDFMRRHTNFSSILEFFSAVGVKTPEDFKKIPYEERSAFISTRTRFSSWEDMEEKASAAYFAKRLEL